jgi:hypothetical protein
MKNIKKKDEREGRRKRHIRNFILQFLIAATFTVQTSGLCLGQFCECVCVCVCVCIYIYMYVQCNTFV